MRNWQPPKRERARSFQLKFATRHFSLQALDFEQRHFSLQALDFEQRHFSKEALAEGHGQEQEGALDMT
jgi:hypothetical protein